MVCWESVLTATDGCTLMSIKAPRKSYKFKNHTRRPVNRPSIKYEPRKKLGLYFVVYESLIGKGCAFVLLLVFLTQATYAKAANFAIEEEINNLTESNLLESQPDSLQLNENIEIGPTEIAVANEVHSLPEAQATIESDLTITTEPTLDSYADEPASVADNDSLSLVEESSTTTNNTPTPVHSTSSFTESTSSIAHITQESAGAATVSTVSNDSSILFKRSECTELASGSFYCFQVPDEVLEDALFAAPDADGDLEIFFIRNGVQEQVTFNLVDDAAPFYDKISDTIVWHRLINDRYQIISYAVPTGSEQQLTNNNVNDMEPVRQGSYTAWQRWIDNNWQIVLFDGVEERVVSRGAGHNVAPNLNSDLLIWHRHTAANQRSLEVYNLVTGKYFTLDDPDGLAVENPRMMLVYDTVQPSGELVTRGYDLLTSRFIDIDTRSRSLPADIPKSEQTGETRALIQNKPTLKVADYESDAGRDDTDDDEPTAPNPLELDLRQIEPVGLMAETETPIADLIIPAYEPDKEAMTVVDQSKTVKD